MQVFLWTFLFRQDYNFKTIRSFLGQRKDSYQIHVKACYKKVKKYIDEEQDYKSPLTIDEILLKLDISKEDYYYALSISVDDDYELHLIRPPNSYFVNNFFDKGLRAWPLYKISNRGLVGIGCQQLPMTTNNLPIDYQ